MRADDELSVIVAITSFGTKPGNCHQHIPRPHQKGNQNFRLAPNIPWPSSLTLQLVARLSAGSTQLASTVRKMRVTNVCMKFSSRFGRSLQRLFSSVASVPPPSEAPTVGHWIRCNEDRNDMAIRLSRQSPSILSFPCERNEFVCCDVSP